MRGFFDKVACVVAGCARDTKAREGAPENTRFRWSALPVRFFKSSLTAATHNRESGSGDGNESKGIGVALWSG